MPSDDTQYIDALRTFGQAVDFGRTSSDYARWRQGFPETFFARLEAAGVGGPGTHVLDLGTGTGSVARGLARRGANVVGLDPAPALLAEAESLDQQAGVSVTYRVGHAEALAFDAASFDCVVAGQSWHWFDRPRAAGEVRRVLRPGGTVVIAHFDWLPLAGNVVAATEALILAHNPAWTMADGTGLYPQWLTDLAMAGFVSLETFSFDLAVPYTHDAWRGRIRASAGVRASLDEASTAKFDAALASLLQRDFPDDPLAVPHRVWAVLGRKATG
jgi:SAM-dependent methyltransferase